MKKFLVIALACMLALPLFGCSKEDKTNSNETNNIEQNEMIFTAEKPEYADFYSRDKNNYYALVARDQSSPFDIYETFKAYYNENIKEKIDGAFYLLKPSDKTFINQPYWKIASYNLYADDLIDGKYVNPCIKVRIEITEDDFDSLQDENDGEYSSSVILSLTINPVYIETNEIEENDFRLEFGNNGENWYETYINIYRGDTCFATCGYLLYTITGNDPWTSEWFENYFKNYLLLQA